MLSDATIRISGGQLSSQNINRIYNDLKIRYVRRDDLFNTKLLQENLGALYRLSWVLRNNYLIDIAGGIENLSRL